MNRSVQSIAAFTTNSWESPLSILRIVGPAKQCEVDVLSLGNSDAKPAELISKADAVLIQRDFPRNVSTYAEIVKQARQENKPVIIDIDDLIFELPENHPDHQSGFYNRAIIPMIKAIMEANLITVSTPALSRYLDPLNPNIYVLPNYLNDDIWNLTDVKKNDLNYPIIIGYMGSDSHLPDINLIEPVLINILEQYQDRVLLKFLGLKPPSSLLSYRSVIWIPSTTYNYAKFSRDFLQQRFDLFIAPLCDNAFNQCKSSIKYLEYSATGTPGVYSNLETYNNIVNHGQNGFLASSLDEWEEYLHLLIENPNLRYEIGLKAQETVRNRYLLSQHASEWKNAWKQSFSAENISIELKQSAMAKILMMAENAQGAQIWSPQKNDKGGINVNDLLEEVEKQTKIIGQQEHTIKILQRELANIYESNAWKFTQRFVRIKMKISSLVKKSDHTSSMSDNNHHILNPLYQVSNENRKAQTEKSTKKKPYDIIVLPIIEWDFRFQRPQQLSLQFAQRGYRIFYIEPKFNLNGLLKIQNIGENLFRVELPATSPIRVYRDTLTEIQIVNLLNNIDALRNDYELDTASLLVELPFWTPLALSIRDKYNWKIVYDCMDYHQGFSSNSEEMLALEEELSVTSDLIVVTSHKLLDLKLKQNPNTIRIPNGADFDHFHSSVKDENQLPNLKPIIGYYGAIADWFDTQLVASLAKSRPDWDFILIGDTLYADLTPFEGVKNIQLLGEIPYAYLPDYLHKFNVAFIPFKSTPLTQATNPVKLFEYLSAGKAVVATNLDEIKYYSKYIHLASTLNEWQAAIESSLQDYSTSRVQERIKFAEENTWEKRIHEFEENLNSLFT